MSSCSSAFKRLQSHEKAVISVDYSPNNQLLATSSADKQTHIINVSTNTLQQTLEEHSYGINCQSWINNNFLVTGSDDKLIKLLDITTGKCVSSSAGHKDLVYSITAHPTTDLIVSGAHDGSIKVWDPRSQNIVASFEAHAQPVTSIEFHKNGRDFITSSLDGYVRLWDFIPSHDCPCLSSLYDTLFTPV